MKKQRLLVAIILAGLTFSQATLVAEQDIAQPVIPDVVVENRNLDGTYVDASEFPEYQDPFTRFPATVATEKRGFWGRVWDGLTNINNKLYNLLPGRPSLLKDAVFGGLAGAVVGVCTAGVGVWIYNKIQKWQGNDNRDIRELSNVLQSLGTMHKFPLITTQPKELVGFVINEYKDKQDPFDVADKILDACVSKSKINKETLHNITNRLQTEVVPKYKNLYLQSEVEKATTINDELLRVVKARKKLLAYEKIIVEEQNKLLKTVALANELIDHELVKTAKNQDNQSSNKCLVNMVVEYAKLTAKTKEILQACNELKEKCGEHGESDSRIKNIVEEYERLITHINEEFPLANIEKLVEDIIKTPRYQMEYLAKQEQIQEETRQRLSEIDKKVEAAKHRRPIVHCHRHYNNPSIFPDLASGVTSGLIKGFLLQ